MTNQFNLRNKAEVNENALARHSKILSIALLHDICIRAQEIELVDLDMICGESCKHIISSAKSLYQAGSQPTSDDIIKNIAVQMANDNYSNSDINSALHKIKQFSESNCKIEVFQVIEAIKALSSVVHAVNLNAIFELKMGSEGYDEEFPYLIKGYIPSNSLGMVYGQSGSFKTFQVLNWAFHIAQGIDWNSQKVCQQTVLYIAGEGGVGVRRRIRALELSHNTSADNLYRLDHSITINDKNGTGSDLLKLIKTIEAYSDLIGKKFGLIIIDTLARCFSDDENNTEAMNRFVSACDLLIARTGATVMIVHHTGKKDKGSARGSSALRAACDFEFRIEKSLLNGKEAFNLVHTKAKNECEVEMQTFTLNKWELFIDSEGEPVRTLAANSIGITPNEFQSEDENPPLSEAQQSIYQIIRQRQAAGESTNRRVILDDFKAQGGAQKNFSRTLSQLINLRLIQNHDNDHLTTINKGTKTATSPQSIS